MSWTDLSQPLSSESDRAGRTRPPRFESVLNIERDCLSMMEYTFVSHIGTHLDAPNHFVPGGHAIDEIALDRVTGEGVVLDVVGQANAGVSAESLDRGGPVPHADGIVLIRTGWEEKAGTPDYFQHPYLLESAVQWLIDRRVKLVAMDLITPDMPEAVRSGPFDWPVHRALLGHQILILENARNMRSLAGRRVEVMAAPINIKGGDGSPVRLLARPLGRELEERTNGAA